MYSMVIEDGISNEICEGAGTPDYKPPQYALGLGVQALRRMCDERSPVATHDNLFRASFNLQD